MRMMAFHLVIAIAVFSFTATLINAQTEEELKESMVKALTLFEAKRYSESIPHFELLVKVMPDAPQLRFAYGFALLAKSKQDATPEEAQVLSAKALEQFKAAKQHGLNDPTNESLIKLLSGEINSEDDGSYSKNPEANKFMNQGESYFAQGKYDDALKSFQKALDLDPTIYQAAVSGADSYLSKGDLANAEIWYQKAIKIDPNRETAYRYSATPLMRQEKYDEARDRYIEALITEPYSQMSPRGITQWAQVTGAKLGHPRIDFPKIEFDKEGRTIMAAPLDNPNHYADWQGYIATRVDWKKNKFAKIFPDEKEYRHTLQEELEAIRNGIKSAKEKKSSNPHFAILEKLDGDGLLEAFILMSEADEGIAEDHAEYLKNNRPKLRQYVLNYVIKK